MNILGGGGEPLNPKPLTLNSLKGASLGEPISQERVPVLALRWSQDDIDSRMIFRNDKRKRRSLYVSLAAVMF